MADSKDKERQRGFRGAGTIRERKDGRLEKRLSLGVDSAGKRIRVSVYGSNLKELHANARDAVRRYNAAKLAQAQNRGTLADFVEDEEDGWLALKEPEISPRTLRNYQREWEAYIKPTLGAIRLEPEDLTVDLVRSWHRKLAKQHGAYTANRVRDLLANILMDSPALQESNPARLVRAARHVKPPVEILTAAELELFIPAASRTRLRNMFILALTTGLRHGEATALHWNDVTFYKSPGAGEDHGELKVRRATITTDDGLRIEPKPKSNAGYRTIGLTEEAVVALRDQQELLAIEGQPSSKLVFPNSAGSLQPVENTARSLRGVIDACNPRLMEWVNDRARELREVGVTAKRARTQAREEAQALAEYEDLLDVKYVSFHDLRHTFASIMISLGMDAARLALVLGHSDAAFTMRTYVQFFEAAKRQPMPSVSLVAPSLKEIGGQNRGSNTETTGEQEKARPDIAS